MAFCMKRFKHWQNKVGALILAIFWAGTMVVPQPVFAESCECFCGDQDTGASSAGPFDSANECAQFCADVGSIFSTALVYVGCYTNEDMYPENNNLCWTLDECTEYPIEISGSTYNGEWGEQSAYCSNKPVTGEAMGYCYGPLIPVVLNVPIMGVTQVGSIGDYVNIVYKYLIPAAAMFAALMFTIAGFQYMTAGGDKSAVSKAKGRMVNTVVGLVLIMSVYTIAYLIDPRLTRFNELRPPLVKKAVMIDDSTTCEALFGYGFCIDGTCPSDEVSIQGECGNKGEITGDDELELNIANAPEVGDECMYSGCSDNADVCIIKGDNSGGICAACNEVSGMNDGLGITPSESTCSQIATRAQREENNKDHIYSCYFDDDLSAFSEADGIGTDECVQFYTSGKQYIDCTAVRDNAATREDGCSAYELLNADSYGIGWSGNLAEITGYGSADSIEDFANVFGSLCEDDICSVADEGIVAQGSCNFVDSNILQDVFDNLIGAGLLTVFDEYGCAGSTTLTPSSEDSSESDPNDGYEYYNG